MHDWMFDSFPCSDSLAIELTDVILLHRNRRLHVPKIRLTLPFFINSTSRTASYFVGKIVVGQHCHTRSSDRIITALKKVVVCQFTSRYSHDWVVNLMHKIHFGIELRNFDKPDKSRCDSCEVMPFCDMLSHKMSFSSSNLIFHVTSESARYYLMVWRVRIRAVSTVITEPLLIDRIVSLGTEDSLWSRLPGKLRALIIQMAVADKTCFEFLCACRARQLMLSLLLADSSWKTHF